MGGGIPRKSTHVMITIVMSCVRSGLRGVRVMQNPNVAGMGRRLVFAANLCDI